MTQTPQNPEDREKRADTPEKVAACKAKGHPNVDGFCACTMVMYDEDVHAPPSTGERGECPLCGAPLDGPPACTGQRGDGEPIYCRNPPHQHRGRAEGQTHDESVDAARHGHLPDPGPPLDLASPEVEPQEQEGAELAELIREAVTAWGELFPDGGEPDEASPLCALGELAMRLDCDQPAVVPASALAKAEAALAQARGATNEARAYERSQLAHTQYEAKRADAAEERERGLREALERVVGCLNEDGTFTPLRLDDFLLVRSALQASSPSPTKDRVTGDCQDGCQEHRTCREKNG